MLEPVAELELEGPTIEVERFIQVTDLQHDMVDADHPYLVSWVAHVRSLGRAKASKWDCVLNTAAESALPHTRQRLDCCPLL